MLDVMVFEEDNNVAVQDKSFCSSVVCAAFVHLVNLRHLVIRCCFAIHFGDDVGFRIFRTQSMNSSNVVSSRDTSVLFATGMSNRVGR